MKEEGDGNRRPDHRRRRYKPKISDWNGEWVDRLKILTVQEGMLRKKYCQVPIDFLP